MKYKLIILFILCSGLAFNQLQSGNFQEYTQDISSDTLYWNENRKLAWYDFQGVPDTNSMSRAVTFSGFVTKSEYTSDTTIRVVISAVFYKKRSWIKEKYRDSLNTLNHEQGHFNITEICARKANAAFRQYKYNRKTVRKDIDSIFNSFVEEQNEMHMLYDRQTTMPINYRKQKEWDKKIEIWLKDN